ncbi:hypothetical protein ASE14_18360 [Agromyces sp. Root81]|nr:hypothetical protein ASE14_18360 [Agromyces sp. Root81]
MTAERVMLPNHHRYRVIEGVGDQYTIPCPAHDDDNPSLSVGWGDSRVILKCHAGCDSVDVLAALDLTWKDLEQPRTIVDTYRYEDEDGLLLYEVVRTDPKSFYQQRPDPRHPERRIKNMQGIKPVPYNLPDVAELVAHGRADDVIWIVEGEKDCQAMRAAYGPFTVATCNHGGAGKWTSEHSAHLAGFVGTIRIVADRDLAGYKHAIKVYDSVRDVGVEVELCLPAAGKDAADHVGDHGMDEFIPASVSALTDLKNAAEDVAKNAALTKATSSENTRNSSAPGRVVLRAAADIISRRQKFLWTDRIPLGAITLFAGRGGVGKSSFAIWLAVEAQHGRLDGDLKGERVVVLYVSVEDHWETQMKPRLIAAGADMTRFYQLSIGFTEDAETGERVPNLPEDAPLILDAIQQQTAPVLVILDPITSTIQGDDHKREIVRMVLDPLAKIAGETDAVVVGIMHFNKGAGNASDKLSGSHAYRDAARAVLLFARDDDSGEIVMSQDKGNYSREIEHSLAYELVDTVVELDDGDIGHVARVRIIGETTTTVAQIINRPLGETNEVAEWLADFMRASGGRVAATDGIEAGKQAGFTESQLTRARRKSRPPIQSVKTGMGGGWEWVSEEIDRAEEFRGNTEEVGILNTEAFATSSGEHVIKRRNRRKAEPDGVPS